MKSVPLIPESDVPPRFAEWGYGMVVADGMGGAASGRWQVVWQSAR